MKTPAPRCIPSRLSTASWDAMAEASKQGYLVATSVTNHVLHSSTSRRPPFGFTHETVQRVTCYRSCYIVDAWRESFAANDGCAGRHRTHDAAVRCGQRIAARNGILGAQRLEDAHYV